MINPKKKICIDCKTPQYIFSHGRCKMCAAIFSGQNKKPKAVKEPTGEGVVFDQLINERDHVSYISGIEIEFIDGVINHCNCAHVLPKAQNKYPRFKLYKKNIRFLTRFEHHLFDNGTIAQREKYKDEMLRDYGLVVDWGKLYELADELKEEYNHRNTAI